MAMVESAGLQHTALWVFPAMNRDRKLVLSTRLQLPEGRSGDQSLEATIHWQFAETEKATLTDPRCSRSRSIRRPRVLWRISTPKKFLIRRWESSASRSGRAADVAVKEGWRDG